MNLDNQNTYWNKVAEVKTFTHPVDIELLEKYVDKKHAILDFGCGYGRIVKILMAEGYKNISGFDTAIEIIKRGTNLDKLPLYHIEDSTDLPLKHSSVDCIILFAVLTCIPSNKGQTELLKLLYSKLKPGGLIYISDYYLQENSIETGRYQYLNNDKNNYGAFILEEGVTFRHHTKEWVSTLLKDFKILQEKPVRVFTMNGHIATAFQIVAQK